MLTEVVAELPNVENALELFSRHVNLHGCWLRTHDAAVELRHLLDEGVGDGISDRVALDILRVQLAKDLEL